MHIFLAVPSPHWNFPHLSPLLIGSKLCSDCEVKSFRFLFLSFSYLTFSAISFGLVCITSLRCLNSTKYKYQEGRTKRESKTEQKGRCNWKERKQERNGEGMWTGRIHEPLLERGKSWTEGASRSYLFIYYLFITASHSTVRTPANTKRERVLASHGKEGRRGGEEKRNRHG